MKEGMWMKIRKANAADFDKVMEILQDGRAQLAERGIDQWQGDYPNPDHVKEDIANGYAYLAKADDGETVGTLTIIPAPDHFYDQLDGAWQIETDQYVTVHRVAIHSDHTGHGYASQLYQAVIDYFQSGLSDIKSVRVDTHEDNLPMQHLIQKSGFKRVGTLHGVYRPNETSYVYELVTA